MVSLSNHEVVAPWPLRRYDRGVVPLSVGELTLEASFLPGIHHQRVRVRYSASSGSSACLASDYGNSLRRTSIATEGIASVSSSSRVT